MLYAGYTILLGRLRTCRVGSEKVTGDSVWCRSVLCPRCRPQFIAVVLFNSAALSSMGQ